MKRTRLLNGLMTSLILFAPIAYSSPQEEIDHLLSFVESTECQYERNGTLHNGVEAAEHIKKRKRIITRTTLNLRKTSSRIPPPKVC